MPHPADVPFALLAHVGDEDQIGVPILDGRSRFESARHRQQRRQSRAVIGHAGPAETAVGIDRNLLAVLGSDHRIEVRREGHQRAFTAGFEESEHIAGAVDLHVAAVAAELRRDPRRALVFKKGWRGNAA